MEKKHFTPLSAPEISAFSSQVAMILKAGISSMEGITLMLEDTGDPKERQLLTVIHDTLLETGSFYEGVKASGVFPAYYLEMVKIGEVSGKLDEVMHRLAVHYDREASISQSIRSALLYPCIMIFMMLLVILVILTKVMPVFQQVFRQLGSEMTGFSGAVLHFGNAIRRYSFVLTALLILFVAAVLYFTRTRNGRRRLNHFLTGFSWTRTYTDRLASCRFAGGMALTLSSGMSPEESMDYACMLTDNPRFLEKLERCRQKMAEGEPLSSALVQTDIFSGTCARMASIAARTGTLDEAMQEIADQYQEEVDQRLNSMIGAIEPTLVILLSVIVGMILLSVMLPLTGILADL